MELDVTWPFERIIGAVKMAEKIYGHVDVLFNNAGKFSINIFRFLDLYLYKLLVSYHKGLLRSWP